MPDLREVFELTTKQMGEPDVDSWREQEAPAPREPQQEGRCDRRGGGTRGRRRGARDQHAGRR